MIKIYNNFVPLNDVKEIEYALINTDAWYFSIDDQSTNSYTLGKTRTVSEYTDIEQYLHNLISEKFDTSRIFRSFSNCFRKGDKPRYHTDPAGVSYMIYLNSIWKWYWGAPTKFKGKRSVYPNPGRLVIFDANIPHKGTAPTIFTPPNIPGRFSIVFHERSK